MSVMLRPQVWMQTLSMHHYSCEWIWEKKVLWLTPENKRMAGFQIQMRVTLKCDGNIWPSTTNFSERLTSFNGEPISSAHSRQVEKKNMANIRTAHNWNHKYFSPKKKQQYTKTFDTFAGKRYTHTHDDDTQNRMFSSVSGFWPYINTDGPVKWPISRSLSASKVGYHFIIYIYIADI